MATDMSSAFISAVLKDLPEARLVFDRFHLMKLLFNEELTELRRQLHREAVDELQSGVLKEFAGYF